MDLEEGKGGDLCDAAAEAESSLTPVPVCERLLRLCKK
jgi:hypothetical protein